MGSLCSGYGAGIKQVRGNYNPQILFICSTSGASIATAGAHPSCAANMCTQPTHSAQEQQHTAHHNGYHDGQLAAAELHFGDGAVEVPHLHLERQTAHQMEMEPPRLFLQRTPVCLIMS